MKRTPAVLVENIVGSLCEDDLCGTPPNYLSLLSVYASVDCSFSAKSVNASYPVSDLGTMNCEP